MSDRQALEPTNGAGPLSTNGDREARLKRLRESFPADAVGKLFKAYDKDEAKRRPKAQCNICDSRHTTAPGVHLDYVGHAAITKRLLLVDPEWNWEPLSVHEDGQPLFVRSHAGYPIGLWIRLTACGVTRLGYGSVSGETFEPEKQLIGDALRNAAMRFGVGLDLWSKEELESELEESPPAPPAKPRSKPHASAIPPRTHLDRTTGELTAIDDPKEEARLRREVAGAFGGDEPSEDEIKEAFGMEPDAAPIVEVLGIPCTISYPEIAGEYVGEKSAFKAKLWREMAKGAANGKAEKFLRQAHTFASEAFEGGDTPGRFLQSAVLTLAEMLRLRAAKEAEEATAIDLIAEREK